MSVAGCQFASAFSDRENLEDALDDVCKSLTSQLTASPHLVVAFLSADRNQPAAMSHARDELRRRLDARQLLACAGESIVGVNREIELHAGLSVWAAHLPQTDLYSMHLTFEDSPDGQAVNGWPDNLPETWSADAALLLLGDPYSFPTDLFLQRLNEDRPGVPIVGGMASASTSPGETQLVLNGQLANSGAIAVLINGGVRIHTIVSQGCRPIGKPFVVTRAERNVIYELGGRPALLQLKEIFDTLPTREQQMVQRGLHVGRVVSEYQDQFAQGDFLIRNVMGIDPEEGSIAIGDWVRVGQTVQFQIRDAQSADVELRQLTSQTNANLNPARAGALMFTCNGRGSRLFDHPHHDASCLYEAWGELPLAGFFAAGEIGPVGGENFVHGFTASILILESADGQ